MALLAHASHELSLFRRSSIRPSLEQGYSGLCSDKVPVTKFLFGDNLADSMKEVQETSKLCSRISQHAKTTPSHGGKQYHNNKGYYKKSNKNHFLGQNYHGQSYHRGEKMESCPTDENTAAYNKAKAEFTRQKLQQTRAAWHEKTSSLNMEKDTGKLWTLTKLLNGEIPEKAQTVLKSEGEYIVQKEAANCLAKLYQEESNVKLPRERTSQVREQLAQLQKQPTSHNCMSQPITMKEIEAAIRQLKCKKAPGPDGVTNDMIKHLGPAAKKTLLELFNESWKNGTVPALWKKATIIPIHKKGKDKKDPNSYRPISLLSCLGKVLERVINRRLISFLEERKILSPTQTGYRKHRSTEDQLALIAQEIENAFQEKKKVVSVFFDLTKAFDKVWREGLLLKILESGISGKMYRWIRCFLQDRSARVKLDGHLSKSVKMREGVPQGGVISPTLFLLYINNITTVLPRHVSNTLHADDLAVWSASEYTTSSAYRIQEAVNKVEQWTNDWGLQISGMKTQATVFSLSTSKEKVAIKLGDKTLPQVETPTFSHIFKPFVKFLSHFQHSEAVSQILKPCPMYLSHFPNILAISQISKSFSTFLSRLSNN